MVGFYFYPLIKMCKVTKEHIGWDHKLTLFLLEKVMSVRSSGAKVLVQMQLNKLLLLALPPISCSFYL